MFFYRYVSPHTYAAIAVGNGFFAAEGLSAARALYAEKEPAPRGRFVQGRAMCGAAVCTEKSGGCAVLFLRYAEGADGAGRAFFCALFSCGGAPLPLANSVKMVYNILRIRK